MSTPSQSEIDAGAKEICAAFESGKPFFIGRNGSTEMELLTYWLYKRETGVSWPPDLLKRLERYSGIWPATPESIDAWVKAYTESLRELDGLAAGWYPAHASCEFRILEEFAPDTFRTPLRSLEPYYVKPHLRWSKHLKDKRVAVISSFADSIYLQCASLPNFSETVWSSIEDPGSLIPTTMDVLPIRSYFPPMISLGDQTGWPADIQSWEDAAESLFQRAKALKPDLVLIGAGALGMIVGAKLKRAGISSLLLGGAIQVLFGIKGRRWETHDVISKFWNRYWVWPTPGEMPTGAGFIEGACYWGYRPSSTPR